MADMVAKKTVNPTPLLIKDETVNPTPSKSELKNMQINMQLAKEKTGSSSLVRATNLQATGGGTIRFGKRTKKITHCSNKTACAGCVLAYDNKHCLYHFYNCKYYGVIKPRWSTEHITIYDLYHTCTGGLWILFKNNKKVTKKCYVAGARSMRTFMRQQTMRVVGSVGRATHKVYKHIAGRVSKAVEEHAARNIADQKKKKKKKSKNLLNKLPGWQLLKTHANDVSKLFYK